MNCCVLPTAEEVFPGDTAIEPSAGGVTVRRVVPAVAFTVAETVVVPCAKVLAVPLAFRVATSGADELQVAVEVKSCVEPSLY